MRRRKPVFATATHPANCPVASAASQRGIAGRLGGGTYTPRARRPGSISMIRLTKENDMGLSP